MKPHRSLRVFAFALCILASAAHSATTVVCLGDSLTEGYGVEAEDAFPSVVERRLRDRGHDVRIVNAGISGATSASGVSRLQWQLRAAPELLILALGGNDGLRGIDPVSTRKNLASAIELARSRGVKVILAGMRLPPNYGPDYVAAFERIFPELAREYELPLIPFLLENVAAQPHLNLPDGIHPNAAGYERVADNVLPVLEPLLEEAAP
jgi:acyl-CoA thioesterase-1